jgi:hypothetical protein
LFFFWRISGTVVAAGVPDIFFATPARTPAPWKGVNKGGTAKIICMIICNARHSPNKFGSALTYANIVTEKNNSRVDCAEAGKKTVQAQRYEGVRIFACRGLTRRSCPYYLTDNV